MRGERCASPGHLVISSQHLAKSSRQIISSVSRSNLILQIPFQTISQMPKIKPMQGDQLPIYELMPEVGSSVKMPLQESSATGQWVRFTGIVGLVSMTTSC